MKYMCLNNYQLRNTCDVNQQIQEINLNDNFEISFLFSFPHLMADYNVGLTRLLKENGGLVHRNRILYCASIGSNVTV